MMTETYENPSESSRYSKPKIVKSSEIEGSLQIIQPETVDARYSQTTVVRDSDDKEGSQIKQTEPVVPTRAKPKGLRTPRRDEIVQMGDTDDTDGGQTSKRGGYDGDLAGGGDMKTAAVLKDISTIETRKVKTKRETEIDRKRVEREKKYERERTIREMKNDEDRQKEEREKHSGKFPTEIGWKIILAFVILVFVLAVACCIVVLIFVEARTDRLTPDSAVIAKIEAKNREILNRIVDTFKEVEKELNNVKAKLKNESGDILQRLSEQITEIGEQFTEQNKTFLKEMSDQRKYIENRLQEQDKAIIFEIHNRSDTLSARTHQLHIGTAKSLMDIEEDLMLLFNTQDTTIDDRMDDLEKKMRVILGGIEMNLQSRINFVQNTLNDGFTGLYSALESHVNGVKDLIFNKVQTSSQKVFGEVQSNSNNFNNRLNTVKADIIKEIDADVSAVKREVIRIERDINNETRIARDNILEAVDGVNSTVGVAIVKVEEVEGNLTDQITEVINYIDEENEDLIEYEDPENCDEVRVRTATGWVSDAYVEGGTYNVYFPTHRPDALEVFCSSRHQGWMVIQRLEDNIVNFDTTYKYYADSFGSALNGNYWLGLKTMHKLTNAHAYKLKIELTQNDYSVITFVYDHFKVGSSSETFALSIGNLIEDESGRPVWGGNFTKHDGAIFTTRDMGVFTSCARTGGGGWWYISNMPTTDACQEVKLTGKNYASVAAHTAATDGIIFGSRMLFYRRAEMSIKLVIERLEDNIVNFDTTYKYYADSFGSALNGNCWLGLKTMHKLTTAHSYKLKIELTKNDYSVITFVYDHFKVGSSSETFALSIGNLIEDESDRVVWGGNFTKHDGAIFTTRDMGVFTSCARTGGGGWWYISNMPTTDACQEVKLTGKNYASNVAHTAATDGIIFGSRMLFYRRAEMSIKLIKPKIKYDCPRCNQMMKYPL